MKNLACRLQGENEQNRTEEINREEINDDAECSITQPRSVDFDFGIEGLIDTSIGTRSLTDRMAHYVRDVNDIIDNK